MQALRVLDDIESKNIYSTYVFQETFILKINKIKEIYIFFY